MQSTDHLRLTPQENAQASSNKANFNLFAYAYSQPQLTGQLKTFAEDFKVEEINQTELSGEGEHLWCWVEKRGQNTDWVAGMLAKWAGTAKHNVGFAGQKDRQAVTKQWFSIQLPGKADPNPADLDIEGVHILNMQRHNKKIQRGELLGNRFELLLRNIKSTDQSLSIEEIKKELDSRLQTIQTHGVPNYFGEQRFGRDGNNLVQGEKLLLSDSYANDRRRKRGAKRDRGNQNQQSLYISALRSWMFNELLSQRIKQKNWDNVIPGDLLQTANQDDFILADDTQNLADLQKKLESTELFITGGLFGDGHLPTALEAKTLEQAIIGKYQAWCDALSQNRVKQDRRALKLMPHNLVWGFEQESLGNDLHEDTIQNQQNQQSLNLKLSFALPAGSFATMVLREILKV
ncbi:tRNA pseudouridine(13) synthase TruD [Thiomicrorhabdus sp.]|uniref:tRNA pseudouridine(13) synthase TruD n=1 Tax=Thiomicrorhabdus sp. TaxID=2039724 RepID=UPI002AA65645|nr:tRNA pseudouridine(13) synthase TruD [Thiomicrorhabdus sp.]